MIHHLIAALARASARGDDLVADFKVWRREHHMERAAKYDVSVSRRRARAAKSREGADTIAPKQIKAVRVKAIEAVIPAARGPLAAAAANVPGKLTFHPPNWPDRAGAAQADKT